MLVSSLFSVACFAGLASVTVDAAPLEAASVMPPHQAANLTGGGQCNAGCIPKGKKRKDAQQLCCTEGCVFSASLSPPPPYVHAHAHTNTYFPFLSSIARRDSIAWLCHRRPFAGFLISHSRVMHCNTFSSFTCYPHTLKLSA